MAAAQDRLAELEGQLNAAQVAAVRRACVRLRLPYVDSLIRLVNADSTDSVEMTICSIDRSYYINTYCRIYDSTAKSWIPFALWPIQEEVLEQAQDAKQFIALKARQEGLTWLFLALISHDLTFRPVSSDFIFSKREDEALYLLGHERLRGMYNRLPEWMRQELIVDSAHQIALANGCGVRAFPSNAGDSYTGTRAFIDEGDLVPNLGDLLNRVQPTVEAGGQLAMVSRVDKSKSESLFQEIYEAGRDGRNAWVAMFIPWYAHPGRDQGWYETKCRDALANEGSLDSIYEQYPATDTEALMGKTKAVRIPGPWLDQVFEELRPIPVDALPAGAPTYTELQVFKLPQKKRKYVLGADPAEGNPTSDDSALNVLDLETGEEMAVLSAKLQPEQLAAAADRIGQWYNNAPVMPERNNHGHAFILWIKDNGKIRVLDGWAAQGVQPKPGWLSNSPGKALLYDDATETIKAQDCILHSRKTKTQLASIQGATLRAPENKMDDAADAWALANEGRKHYQEFWMEVW